MAYMGRWYCFTNAENASLRVASFFSNSIIGSGSSTDVESNKECAGSQVQHTQINCLRNGYREHLIVDGYRNRLITRAVPIVNGTGALTIAIRYFDFYFTAYNCEPTFCET